MAVGRRSSSNDLFFSSRRRHTRYWRDWSSDVCSSDLTYSLERSERGLGIGCIVKCGFTHGFHRHALFLHKSGEFPIGHGRKITVLYIPTADHSKGWGLYTPQRITSPAYNGKSTARIDTHQPIGFAPCLGGVIEIIVT